jgi:uncharacterized protein
LIKDVIVILVEGNDEMNGTLVNAMAIVIGSLIGMRLANQFIKERSEAVMAVLGLCVLVIGVQGVIAYPKLISLILSLALGFVWGEAIHLDEKINHIARQLELRFAKEQRGQFAQGLISASLLFCVGAMAIIGSIESGLRANETILYTKSLLDFISSIIFASSFGMGVLFSSVVVLIYQGSITLLSAWIAPFLTSTLIQDISSIGSLLIVALGFNMMRVSQFKIANLLPALLVMVVISLLGFSI